MAAPIPELPPGQFDGTILTSLSRHDRIGALVTSPNPPVPPPGSIPGRKEPWYQHKRWAIVGGVVAGLSLLAAFGAWLFPVQAASPGAGTPDVRTSAAFPVPASATPTSDPVITTVAAVGAVTPDCGAKGYLFLKGLGQLTGDPPAPGPPLYEGLADWLPKHGGVEVVSFVRMTVESPQSKAVILTGLRAVVDSRAPAVGAVGVVAQCGGGMADRYFLVDLTPATPTVASLPGEGGMGAPPTPAATFPFKVSDVDPEYFTILMKRPPGDVTWHLEVSWTLDGVTGVSRLPKGTGLFHSTSAPLFLAGDPQSLLSHPRAVDCCWQP
jgi:hypothetical protein